MKTFPSLNLEIILSGRVSAHAVHDDNFLLSPSFGNVVVGT